MLEIRNRSKSPVQLVVRSKNAPRQMTVWNIPGIGGGKNVIMLEDERVTEYVHRAERDKLISTRHVPNNNAINRE